MTSDDIDKMIADAEKYREQDEELNDKIEYKTHFEEALFTAQSKAAETNKPNEMKELADLRKLEEQRLEKEREEQQAIEAARKKEQEAIEAERQRKIREAEEKVRLEKEQKKRKKLELEQKLKRKE